MRRIDEQENEHVASQSRRAGDGTDPDDLSAKWLVEVLIFGGTAISERHQEPGYDKMRFDIFLAMCVAPGLQEKELDKVLPEPLDKAGNLLPVRQLES